MSYPPPSAPGQPPPYGQRSRKKKYTAAGVLGAAASIATILTLFITLDQQPQPNNGPNTNGGSATTAADVYPVNVQSNFLNSCEVSGPQSVCECSLTWFEQHVSLTQFEQDESDVVQGGRPADIAGVQQACG